ncbi:MAG: hypothetical protein ACRD2W_07190, partial [Acidimicrobiales bacterium]
MRAARFDVATFLDVADFTGVVFDGVLSFSAPPSDGPDPPPASRYEVRKATSPIGGERRFAAATALCGGECVFAPDTVGRTLTLVTAQRRARPTTSSCERSVTSAGRSCQTRRRRAPPD